MFEGDAGLFVGTSSWSNRDWVGGFYPLRTPSNRFIEHYAKIYDTVEIDATFYASPGESHIANWRRRTPESFCFAAKVPRTITHEKVLVDADGEMLEFLDAMSGLGPRVGPLLFQFPRFRKSEVSEPEFFRRLERFLTDLPRTNRYAVEVRNPEWVGEELQTLCAEHRVSLTWADRPEMFSAQEWGERVGGASTDFLYLRWIGDYKGMERRTQTWDRMIVDRTDDIETWVPIIRSLRQAGVSVFTYVNNHYAGNGPQTIELLRKVWRRTIGLPEVDPERPAPTELREPPSDGQMELPF